MLPAAGLLAANIEHEKSVAFAQDLQGLSIGAVKEKIAELDSTCAALMTREAIGDGSVERLYVADICYIGQSHHLEVPLRLGEEGALARLYEDFNVAHERVFGHAQRAPARVVNLRSLHFVRTQPPLPTSDVSVTASRAHQKARNAHSVGETAAAEARIYTREQMTADIVVDGPTIIEQADTTTLVPGLAGEKRAG